MAYPKDITGNRYGKLVAIERTVKKNGGYYWKCQCDCGNTKEISESNLCSGKTKSCGCLRVPPLVTKHNGSNEKLYGIWTAMKQRCQNKNDRNYFRYGGRGISVCDEWSNNYGAFREWCYEHGYKEGLELDREDNNGDYTPENCRFVTHRENLLNTHRAKKYREANNGIDLYYRVMPSTEEELAEHRQGS